MKKETQNKVVELLTGDHTYANGTGYSLSLTSVEFEDFSYYTVTVFMNADHGSIHEGYADYFLKVADVTKSFLSFRSINGVCVCRFS